MFEHLRATGPIAAVIVIALALRVTTIGRDGFSPDEDLTRLAARGVEARGVPVLPSGVLYDRGLLYSYAAWGAGAITAPGLVAYRAVSALCGVCSVLLVFVIVRRLGGPIPAVAASFLLAVQPEHVALSQWARFYGPFIAAALLGTWVFVSGPRQGETRLFAATVVVARLLHEMGAALVLLPLFAMLVTARDSAERARHRRLALAAIAAVALVQASLFSAHYLSGMSAAEIVGRWEFQAASAIPPPSSAWAGFSSFSMAWRGASTVLLACGLHWLGAGILLSVPMAALGIFGCFAGLVFLTVFAAVARARPTHVVIVSGLVSIGAGVLANALGLIIETGAPYSLKLFASVTSFGFSGTTDAVHYYARIHPGLFALLVAMTAALAVCDVPAKLNDVRAIVLSLVAGLFVLGVLRFGYDARYFAALSPLVLVAAGAFAGSAGPHRLRLTLFVGIATMAILVSEYAVVLAHATPGMGRDAGFRAVFAPPTLYDPAWADFRNRIGRSERIFCNDEPASLVVIGRCDYWLAFDRQDRARFAVATPSGFRSAYTGAPLIGSEQDFRKIVAADCRDLPCWIVLVNTGRFGFEQYENLAPGLAAAGEYAVDRARSAFWMLARIPPRTNPERQPSRL